MTREFRSNRRRWLVAVSSVVILAIAGGLVAWLIPKRDLLQTAVVQRKNIENKIFASGTVKPVERQVVMPNQLSAPIAKVDVVAGQPVKAGQALVECQNSGQVAALHAAATSVSEAQQTLADTQQQAAAAPVGFQGQFIGTIASEKSSLAQAQAQLEQARAAYDATVIRSALNGTVILVNPAGIAQDGTASPVVEVVGAGKQVVINVSELDAVHIEHGMSAELTSDAFPNATWQGGVTRVSGFATTTGSGTGQVEVDLGVPRNFPVPLGYQVSVRIVTMTHQQVPVVPYAALTQDGNSYVVFTVRNGKAHKDTVTLGITTDTEVEVSKGLSPGDRVIVNPPASLADEQAVNVS